MAKYPFLRLPKHRAQGAQGPDLARKKAGAVLLAYPGQPSLDEAIWLDRREIAEAFRDRAPGIDSGWPGAIRMAIRRFVTRMQLGPASGFPSSSFSSTPFTDSEGSGKL